MPGFLTGDATHLEVVWNRISHTIQGSAATSIDGVLTDLRAAAESGDYTASADAGLALRQALSGLWHQVPYAAGPQGQAAHVRVIGRGAAISWPG